MTRTWSWASNSFEPSYFGVAPVQVVKSFHESMCGWSSGATIEV